MTAQQVTVDIDVATNRWKQLDAVTTSIDDILKPAEYQEEDLNEAYWTPVDPALNFAAAYGGHLAACRASLDAARVEARRLALELKNSVDAIEAVDEEQETKLNELTGGLDDLVDRLNDEPPEPTSSQAPLPGLGGGGGYLIA